MNLLTQLYEVHRKDLEGFNLTLKENIDLLPEEQKSMSLLELVQVRYNLNVYKVALFLIILLCKCSGWKG